MTKKSMSESLKQMYNNLNYYYTITGSLHNHKTYDEQLNLVRDIQANITGLSKGLDEAKEHIEKVEKSIHDQANTHFKDNDHYMNYD